LIPQTQIPTNPPLVSGTPMKMGQAVGNEGVNVYVDRLVTNSTATYEGCFVDNKSMTFLSGGTPSTVSPMINGDFSQPIIAKRYAEKLYEIENLTLVTNPTMVKLTEGNKEFKIFMYHGASIHNFINEVKELREMKAHRCPAKAIRHMLKRRHLCPMHGEAHYVPNEDNDPLVIAEVPDVFCTGEVHRMDIENYNGVLIITGSCWQAQTDFEEKVGNIPDPGKICMINLKSREIKLFDFLDEEESNEYK
jgi:predicted phosphodiesterase